MNTRTCKYTCSTVYEHRRKLILDFSSDARTSTTAAAVDASDA